MTKPARAFISYVREDHVEVDRLVAALRAANIEVWLDRDDIPAGARWKDTIRRAIRDRDHFIAFFSPASAAKQRTHMNEELLIAIEELRLRPRNRAWFLPVALGPGLIPDVPIGPGETLRDIQYVDIAADWDRAVARLIAVLT